MDNLDWSPEGMVGMEVFKLTVISSERPEQHGAASNYQQQCRLHCLTCSKHTIVLYDLISTLINAMKCEELRWIVMSCDGLRCDAMNCVKMWWNVVNSMIVGMRSVLITTLCMQLWKYKIKDGHRAILPWTEARVADGTAVHDAYRIS